MPKRKQRHLQVIHRDGFRMAIAIGFDLERDVDDLSRIEAFVVDPNVKVLAVAADVSVEHVHA